MTCYAAHGARPGIVDCWEAAAASLEHGCTTVRAFEDRASAKAWLQRYKPEEPEPEAAETERPVDCTVTFAIETDADGTAAVGAALAMEHEGGLGWRGGRWLGGATAAHPFGHGGA